MGNPDEPRVWWTLPQRRALAVLCSALLIWLIFLTARDRLHLPNQQPPRGVRVDELADRIDPNTADWPTLAALPQLGEKRAKLIVAYREEHAKRQPNRPAFEKPEDLFLIKGIGPAMVSLLTPYLVFPSDKPATAPHQERTDLPPANPPSERNSKGRREDQ